MVKGNLKKNQEPKDASYCVLENPDGARLMEMTVATEFLKNVAPENRHLCSMHFAGSLEDAKQLMVVIENQKKAVHTNESVMVVNEDPKKTLQGQ
jgi:hypothetical protein